MNIEKFQSGLAEVLFSPYGDSQFDAIRAVCKGMSGTKTAKLLNFAVSCLDKGELYFEIGVLTGYTMISAGLGQKRNIIGVDNWSEFGDHQEALSRNIGLFANPNSQFINADFRKVAVAPENEKKTGVLYIDGKHEYQEVLDSLQWGENGILSDQSIVVLDDISVNGVSEAIEEWTGKNEHYKTIFYLKPYFDDSNQCWSHDISIGLGLAVLKRERKVTSA